MISTLALTLDVLERADKVAMSHEPFDAKTEALRLLRKHPEANAKVSEIEALIRSEIEVARQIGGDIRDGRRMKRPPSMR